MGLSTPCFRPGRRGVRTPCYNIGFNLQTDSKHHFYPPGRLWKGGWGWGGEWREYYRFQPFITHIIRGRDGANTCNATSG